MLQWFWQVDRGEELNFIALSVKFDLVYCSLDERPINWRLNLTLITYNFHERLQ